MNFLVISDSHRRRDNIAKAAKRCAPLDAILYLGDGTDDFDDKYSYNGTPLFLVRGNCDFFENEQDVPSERVLHFEEYTIMMTHGHLLDVEPTYFEKAAARAAELGADILLFGYTHFPLEKYLAAGTEVCGVTIEKPLYVFNPGSIGRLRSDTGFKYYFGTMSLLGKDVIFGHGTL